MNKFEKLLLALSCFSPLFLIFGIKNAYELHLLHQHITFSADDKVIALLNIEVQYNLLLLLVWFALILFSILGVIRFVRRFLNNKSKSKEHVLIVTAKNITADYFFTYFSLFVLSFLTIDPTKKENMIEIVIFAILLVGMLAVYIVNDMFFINPVLNLLGYKSFDISYQKARSCAESSEKNLEFQTRVFSKINLNRQKNEKCYISFSPHDFSICYPDDQK